MPSTSLDVQELYLGKYVVKWAREKEGMDEEFLATSTFDMGSTKVAQSSLFVSANLPAYGVVRTPLRLQYGLTNRTDKVQEFAVLMQPREAFMFSGNKQHHIKILPQQIHRLEYVLYPLLPGESVSLPQLKLTSVRLAQLTDDLDVTLRRMLPTHITVLPRNREAAAASTGGGGESENAAAASSNAAKFHVNEPHAMHCKPLHQAKPTVKS